MLHFSEIGHARNNEAHHGDGNYYDANRNLMVVCDGVSSQNGSGKIAAKAFADTFDDKGSLTETVEKLIDSGKHQSTIVIALIRENLLEVCAVGDSRAYLIRGGEITQLTTDHSLYEGLRPHLPQGVDPRRQETHEIIAHFIKNPPSRELIAAIREQFFMDNKVRLFRACVMARILDKLGHAKHVETCIREMKTYRGADPYSATFLGLVIARGPSAITHLLGYMDSKSVATVKKIPIKPKDEILACSDGFSNLFVDEKEIMTVIEGQETVIGQIQALFEEAKSRGIKDDLTLLLGRIAD